MTIYLSFVGDHGFLGVAIVEADSVADAITDCWRRSINPGGEVMAWEVPEDRADSILPHQMNRLLTRDEALAVGRPQ